MIVLRKSLIQILVQPDKWELFREVHDIVSNVDREKLPMLLVQVVSVIHLNDVVEYS